jgi:hypothetical protein
MSLQEKKYSIDSFDPVLAIIKEKGLIKTKEVTSVHYYGNHEGNDVEKFVEYHDRVEAHVWKEVDGKFTPTENFLLRDKNDGFNWLKKRGFTKANIVKMKYSEYGYKEGIIGLYTVDDFHKSIILSYPAGEHETIEKELGLENSEVITLPYNKLLEKMGKLRSINLD